MAATTRRGVREPPAALLIENKEPPLALEEWLAAFVLLAVAVGTFCRFVGTFCRNCCSGVKRKPSCIVQEKGAQAAVVRAPSSPPAASSSNAPLEQQLAAVLKREADLNKVIGQVRNRASRLKQKLGQDDLPIDPAPKADATGHTASGYALRSSMSGVAEESAGLALPPGGAAPEAATAAAAAEVAAAATARQVEAQLAARQAILLHAAALQAVAARAAAEAAAAHAEAAEAAADAASARAAAKEAAATDAAEACGVEVSSWWPDDNDDDEDGEALLDDEEGEEADEPWVPLGEWAWPEEPPPALRAPPDAASLPAPPSAFFGRPRQGEQRR